MQRVKETAWIAALQGRSMYHFYLLLFCGALLMQHTRTYRRHVDDVPFFFFLLPRSLSQPRLLCRSRNIITLARLFSLELICCPLVDL